MAPSDPPPFSRLSREVLVDNQWHRYCLDRYTRRDGSEGRYYYIDMPGSCGTIPLFADGSTVLVAVRRYLLGGVLWEFPIGGMKDGEDPLVVAQAELREEAGLVGERWMPLGSFAPYKGVSNERCHFFVAEGLTWTDQELELSEDITVHQMPFEEARRTLLDQELGCGQSMAGLMLYDRWRASAS
ncbi:MAG: NUDIX hydrolase [Planctomycetota bacterium]